MRITKAVIEKRMNEVMDRYRVVVGVPIDTSRGHAQCMKFSSQRLEPWSCSLLENAHRLYGEYSSLRDLLDEANS